jgi:hypothetical protein
LEPHHAARGLDDWGGFYETTPAYPLGLHQPAPFLNNNADGIYGYRVPLIAISPNVVAPGTLDNTGPQIDTTHVRSQASILTYIEHVFNVGEGALGTADMYSDDLTGVNKMLLDSGNLGYTPMNEGNFAPKACPDLSGLGDNT